jgi:hypothetical protein
VLAIAFLPETAGSALHDLDTPEPVPTGGPVAPAG